MAITNWTATLPDDILKDTGVLFINSSTPFGASDGGLGFDPATEWTNTNFDMKRSPIMGMDRVTGRVPMISGTLVVGAAGHVTGLYEPGSTSATNTGVTTVTPKAANAILAAGEYLTNVRLAYERQNGAFAWVLFEKALCTKYSLKGTDKEAAKFDIEIVARLDMTNVANTLDTCPYKIQYAASLS